MATRLEKFRGYLAGLAPAADPIDAVREGLYVPRAGRSIADEIAARLEMDSTSSHLVVGGIGSGKTTQLLVARDRLSKLPGTRAEYVDVSRIHDISRMDGGALLVIAGLLLDRLTSKLGEDELAFRVRDQLLRDRSIEDLTKQLSALREGLRAQLPRVVLLIDSLDRLVDMATFVRLVEQDVRAIHEAGIGVVLVGPLHSMLGSCRSIVDQLQHVYLQPAVDVQPDSAGRAFLVEVLRKRAPSELLTEEACVSLAALSGGVLRDLLSLARSAGEEAYMSGADEIDVAHAATAADAFGRKLIFGLGPEELEVLQGVRKTGTFVQASDRDLALLVTRRVLECQDSARRFAVHPTLVPLLERMDLVEHEA